MNNASDPNQADTPLTALLLQLLPADHSAVGNGAKSGVFRQGLSPQKCYIIRLYGELYV
jgi:hypothetical protein